MFRTALVTAAAALVVLGAVTPVMAADADVMPVTAAAGANAAADLASDTDWSMPTVHFGTPARVGRGSLLPGLYASLAALNAYDAYSTTTGLKQGAFESNGVLKGVAGHSAAMWAVKGGATAASIFVAERLWKNGHRAQSIAVMLVSNGLMASVAAHNASVLNATR